MNWPEALITILGLGLVTLLTRGFFLLPDRDWPLPAWLRQGLRHAPLAALAAVIVPEVVMTQGELLDTWRDPRLFAATAAVAWYFWRRSVLGTIIVGSSVMLAIRLGLGW